MMTMSSTRFSFVLEAPRSEPSAALLPLADSASCSSSMVKWSSPSLALDRRGPEVKLPLGGSVRSSSSGSSFASKESGAKFSTELLRLEELRTELGVFTNCFFEDVGVALKENV